MPTSMSNLEDCQPLTTMIMGVMGQRTRRHGRGQDARACAAPRPGQVEDPYSARFHPRSIGEKSRTAPTGRGVADERDSRGVTAAFRHQPVMVDEVVELFGPVPRGVVVDATVGGAGHAQALLEAHPHIQIVGLDRDEAAVAAAMTALPGRR